MKQEPALLPESLGAHDRIIVGGGAASVMILRGILRTLNEHTGAGEPPHIGGTIYIVDDDHFRGGAAYRTRMPTAVLNEITAKSSLDDRLPLDFTNFTGAGDDEFQPRPAFGDYLAARRAEAVAALQAFGMTVVPVQGRAHEVQLNTDGSLALTVARNNNGIGDTVFVPHGDQLVYAKGHVRQPPFVQPSDAGGRYLVALDQLDALRSIIPLNDPAITVGLIGTGPSGVDTVVALDGLGLPGLPPFAGKIVAFSASGLWPQRRDVSRSADDFKAVSTEVFGDARNAADLNRNVMQAIAAAESQGWSPREAAIGIDVLELMDMLGRQGGVEEAAAFRKNYLTELTHLMTPIPPVSHHVVQQWKAEGKLTAPPDAARVAEVIVTDDKATIVTLKGDVMPFDYVVDCRGFCKSIDGFIRLDPLWASLSQQGTLRSDGSGNAATDNAHRLTTLDGRSAGFAVGGIRRIGLPAGIEGFRRMCYEVGAAVAASLLSAVVSPGEAVPVWQAGVKVRALHA